MARSLRSGLYLAILLNIVLLFLVAVPAPALADSSQTVNFIVRGEPYNFTITTSSTLDGSVTSFGETKFNFTLSGTTGTNGWANATVCKTAGFFPPGQARPQNIKIYMNDTEVENGTETSIFVQQIDPSQPVVCIWVYWTYHHSSWETTADLSLSVPVQAPDFTGALPLAAVAAILGRYYAVYRRRQARST